MKSGLVFAAAAVATIALANPALAWDVAPQRYITAAATTPSVVFEWPQWRLQDECGPEAHEATEGRTILACTWQAYGLCFTAMWNGIPDEEFNDLLYLHELPHCVGWGWDHPGGEAWDGHQHTNMVAAR